MGETARDIHPDIQNLAYNISIKVFLTASALLYIPIVVSIRRLANLESAKINEPQIFVAVQLVAVVAKQMVFLTMVLIYETCNKSVHSKYRSLTWAFGNIKVTDILVMAIITQNRRNLMTLCRSLKPTCCTSNAVDPNNSSNYMENMETTQQ